MRTEIFSKDTRTFISKVMDQIANTDIKLNLISFNFYLFLKAKAEVDWNL